MQRDPETADPAPIDLHRMGTVANVARYITGPDGTLAYVVRAALVPGHNFPRIGLRGTAKIYGERVTLFYYLARRPLAAARQFLGW